MRLKEFILRLQSDDSLDLQRLSIPPKPNYRSQCKYESIGINEIADTEIEIFLAPTPGLPVTCDKDTLVKKIHVFLQDKPDCIDRIKFHFAFPMNDEIRNAFQQTLKETFTTELPKITFVFYEGLVVRRETTKACENTDSYQYCPYAQYQEPYVLITEAQNAVRTRPITGKHSQWMIDGEILRDEDHQKIAWCEDLLWLIRHKQFQWSSTKHHPKYQVLQQLGDQVQTTLNEMSFLPSSTDLTLSNHIQQCSSHLFRIIGELIVVFETWDDRTLDQIIDLKQDDSRQSPPVKAKMLHSRSDYLHHLGIKSQFTTQLITHLDHGAKLFPTVDFVKCLELLKTKLQKSKEKWDHATDKAKRLEHLITQIEKIIQAINDNQSDVNRIETQVTQATKLVQTSSNENNSLRDKRHPAFFWQRAKSWTALRQAEKTLTSLSASDNPPSNDISLTS